MEIKTCANCLYCEFPSNQIPCNTCDFLTEGEATNWEPANEGVAADLMGEISASEYRPERYTTPDCEGGYVLRSNGVFIHGPAIERFAAFENIG